MKVAFNIPEPHVKIPVALIQVKPPAQQPSTSKTVEQMVVSSCPSAAVHLPLPLGTEEGSPSMSLWQRAGFPLEKLKRPPTFFHLLGGHGEGGDPSLIRHPGQKGALILEQET